MNRAFLYSKYNALQKNDATFVLDNYLKMVEWRDDGEDAILDIGSGSGDVMMDLLYPRLPKKFGKLVGADISEEMVEFARDKYREPNVFFEELNVESEDVPVDFEDAFHHILSFNCLHWVQNQKKAMENLYKMLKPGGDMLLTFAANNPIFDIYEAMSKTGRWMPYMENFKNYISPYQYSENPDKELKTFLDEAGFKTQLCKVQERIYVYTNLAVLKKSVIAVSPFYNKIPEDMRNDYFTDYMVEVKKMNLIQENNNNKSENQHVNVPYKIFIVYAHKV